MESSIQGTNGLNFYISFFFSYNYFWYLQAMFIIFLFVLVAEKHKLIDSRYSIISFIIFFFIASSFISKLSLFVDGNKVENELEGYVSVLTFFSWRGSLYIMPYFLLGLLIQRFELLPYLKNYRMIFFIPTIVGIALQEISFFHILSFDIPKTSILAGLCSTGSCLFLASLNFKNYYLAIIGGFAYPIYLFHNMTHEAITRIIYMLGIIEPGDFVGIMYLSKIILGISILIIISVQDKK